jgi:MarR family transcriptional regulator, organic hydroperoxide resistance regulator
MPTRAPLADLSPAASLPDILEFMQVLWAVVHGLQRTSKRMAANVGVTGPQRLVLRVVGLLPGISAGNLAAILRVHPSTLTGVLERLARQQLLARADDPADRRRAVLRLTTRGARVNAIKRNTVESAIANALIGVSGRDRTATRRTLERIAWHLELTTRRTTTPLRPEATSTKQAAQSRTHDVFRLQHRNNL